MERLHEGIRMHGNLRRALEGSALPLRNAESPQMKQFVGFVDISACPLCTSLNSSSRCGSEATKISCSNTSHYN